jgi:hypothetical protein
VFFVRYARFGFGPDVPRRGSYFFLDKQKKVTVPPAHIRPKNNQREAHE